MSQSVEDIIKSHFLSLRGVVSVEVVPIAYTRVIITVSDHSPETLHPIYKEEIKLHNSGVGNGFDFQCVVQDDAPTQGCAMDVVTSLEEEEKE